MEYFLEFGGDFVLTPAGTIQTVEDDQLIFQRIVRRLLTVPSTYIWHPTYGAGLGADIGKVLTEPVLDKLTTLIINQVQLEESIASNPAPTAQLKDNGNDVLFCQITYYKAASSAPNTVSFTVSLT